MGNEGTPAWLGRYRQPSVLREGRHFELVSVLGADDRRGALLVRPGTDARPAEAARALGALAEAHAAITHPCVPASTHVSTDTEPFFVELACEVAIDAGGLRRSLSDRGLRLPYAQLMVLRDALLDAMEAAHATGRALGRLSLADLWLSADAHPWVLGWGAHVSVERDDGSIDPMLGALEAPDVAIGAAPTPASDLTVALLWSRALLGVTALPAALARGMAGQPETDDAAVLALARALDAAFLAALPHERPSFEAGRAMIRQLDARLGEAPDPIGLRRTLESALVHEADASGSVLALAEPTEKVLMVHASGDWIDLEAKRTTLGPAQRAILGHLLERWRTHPGETTQMWTLLEIGWPGERVQPEAGSNRVYTAINRLRALGLRETIEWHEGGYRVAPAARITTIR